MIVMDNSNFITSWQEVHTIVDDAMAKGSRSVSIYTSSDGGTSVLIFPGSDEETLRKTCE